MYKKHIWEIIPWLKIHGKDAPYPVLNERAIRATAWIMFVLGITTFFYTFYTKDYTGLTIMVLAFFTDFFIKVMWGPKYSPFSMLGKFFVSKQKPEYVGAIQKRFAWGLGLIMASSMIFIAIIFEMRGPLPLSICSICLTLMWMESALGICVGCKIYYFLIKKGILKAPEVKPACPGWACSIGVR